MKASIQAFLAGEEHFGKGFDLVSRRNVTAITDMRTWRQGAPEVRGGQSPVHHSNSETPVRRLAGNEQMRNGNACLVGNAQVNFCHG